MFNIKDSYITPIILSYVNKYIKDVRLEDTELRLWRGAAVFHDVSLRLDVLERELALPFTFLSGHIHELQISVPWTKLHVEPIKVTINTIECVLKLKDTTSSTNVDGEPSEGASKVFESGGTDDAAAGYVQGIVNRIVSNVTIECNNLILKYVEDDIVLSLNVRSLVVQSANENWQPAFQDVASGANALRKAIAVNDLTICLDRRNASGKIDFFEEPLLYKCSLEIHLGRSFTATTPAVYKTVLDIRCPRMDFSVSEKQCPMLIRIFGLLMAFYSGEITSEQGKLHLTCDSPCGIPGIAEEMDPSHQISEGQDNSWSSWAWSVTSILSPLFLGEDEDTTQSSDSREDVMMCGISVDSVTVVVSLSGIERDCVACGCKKLRTCPSLLCTVKGSYAKNKIVGCRETFCTFGACEILVQPTAETCYCGVRDPLKIPEDVIYFAVGHQMDAYQGICDEEEAQRLFRCNLADDVVGNELLLKSPALAVQYCYTTGFHEDSAEQLDYKHFHGQCEHSSLYVLTGQPTVTITPGLLQRAERFIRSFGASKYQAYKQGHAAQAVRAANFLGNSLDINSPTRTYKLCVPVICFEIHLHDPNQIRSFEGEREDKQIQSEATFTKIVGKFENVKFILVNPMYPNELTTAVSDVSHPSDEMLALCYSSLKMDSSLISCDIHTPHETASLVQVRCVNYSCKTLYHPEKWSSKDKTTKLAEICADSTKVSLGILQMTTVIRLTSFFAQKASEDCLAIKCINDERTVNRSPFMECCIASLHIQHCSSVCGALILNAQIERFHVYLMHPDLQQLQKHTILEFTGNTDGVDEMKMFSLLLQIPESCSKEKSVPLILTLKVLPMKFYIFPDLISLLTLANLIVQKTKKKSTIENKLAAHDKLITKKRFSKGIPGSADSKSQTSTYPQESVHTAGENARGVPNIESASLGKSTAVHKEQNFDGISNLRALVSKICGPLFHGTICMEIDCCTMIFCDDAPMVSQDSVVDGADSKPQKVTNSLAVSLPSVLLKAANYDQVTLGFLNRVPLQIVTHIQEADDSMPWSLSFQNMKSYCVFGDEIEEILSPFSTKCTIALSRKTDKSEINGVGLCVHADSTDVTIDLTIRQAELVVRSLLKLVSLFEECDDSSSVGSHGENEGKIQFPENLFPVQSRNSLLISNSAESISDPIESSHGDISDTANASIKIAGTNIWTQWTLARCAMSLQVKSETLCGRHVKAVVVFEDVMSSMDIQNVYCKVKSKIGSCSVRHEMKDDKDADWHVGERLGLLLRCSDDFPSFSDSSSSSKRISKSEFFSVIYTSVLCENLHNQLSTEDQSTRSSETVAKLPAQKGKRYVTEYLIFVCPIDLVVDYHIISDLFVPLHGLVSGAAPERKQIGKSSHRKTLPLLHIEAKRLRIFLPPAEDTCSETFVTQIDQIVLTPQVTNPITRVFERPDLYNIALRANILNVPGSQLEDRQYQLDIKHIIVNSCKWYEAETYLKSVESNSIGTENPAANWNKLGDDVNVLLDRFLITLVSPCDICLILAPAIHYIHTSGDVVSDVLICGHSCELSLDTNVEVFITTEDVVLICEMLSKWSALFLLQKSHMKLFDECLKMKDNDSGIEFVSSKTSTRASRKLSHDDVPVDIFLTAKEISLFLMNKSNEVRGSSSVPSGDSAFVPQQRLNTLGWKNSFIDKNCFIESAMHFIVYQPHAVMSCNSLREKLEVSIYDLTLKRSKTSFTWNFSSSLAGMDSSPMFVDFLETRSGDYHPRTGVPSSFFTATWTNILNSSDERINLNFDRSFHVRVSNDPHLVTCFEQFFGAMSTCRNILSRFSAGGLAKITQESEFKTEKSVCKMMRFHIVCKQIVVQLFDCKSPKKSLRFCVSNISSQLSPMVSQQTGLGSISTSVEVTSLGISILEGAKNIHVLQPFNASLNLEWVWEAWLRECCLLRCKCEVGCLNLDIRPHDVEFLRTFLKTVHEQYIHFAVQDNMNDKSIRSSTKPSFEYYNDDLRAGAFQFVECRASGTLPVSYQVMFSKEPLSITWRYPQPRSITKVEIAPLPSVLGCMRECLESVNCILQQWNECKGKFVTFHQFQLSQFNTVSLSLPDPRSCNCIRSSSLWRIVIYPKAFDSENQISHFKICLLQNLVSCTRIDSMFGTSLIPPQQFFISCSSLRCNVVFDKEDVLPTPQQCEGGLKSDSRSPEKFPLITFAFDSNQLEIVSRSDETLLIEFDSTASIEMVDMLFLKQLKLLEPFHVSIMFSYVMSSLPSISLEIACGQLSFILSEPIFHYILAVIQRLLHPTASRPIISPGFCRLVLCHSIAGTLSFRQCGCDDDIKVHRNQFHMYSWQCNKEKQIAVGMKDFEWSKSIDIARDCTDVAYIRNKDTGFLYGFVYKVSSLSTQWFLNISGTLTIFNTLRDSVICRLSSVSHKDNFNNEEEFHLDEKLQSVSVMLPVYTKCTLRIKFASHPTNWSGEIPISASSTQIAPWLVKVPLQGNSRYFTISCRQFVQNLENGSRILLVLSPMYEVSSFIPINVTITSQADDAVPTMFLDAGKHIQVNIAGTIDDRIQIHLQGSDENKSPIEPSAVDLSYQASRLPSSLSVSGPDVPFDNIIEQLQHLNQNDVSSWPFLPLSNAIRERLVWIPASKKPLKMYTKNFFSGPTFSTLHVQLLPWATLLNLLDVPLFLDYEDARVQLPAFSATVPPRMRDTFLLMIAMGECADSFAKSSPIQLDYEKFDNDFEIPKITGVVPRNGCIQVLLFSDINEGFLINVQSRVDNENHLVITMMPTVLLSVDRSTNMPELYATCICVDVCETRQFLPDKSIFKDMMCTYQLNAESTPLISWFYLSSSGDSPSLKAVTEMTFYIVIHNRGGDHDWACPVMIALPDMASQNPVRQCFSIGEHPLVLCTNFHDDQIVAVVSYDHYPDFIIHNNCSFPLFCAESADSRRNSTDGQRKRSEDLVNECSHFSWNCLVKPNEVVPYSIPSSRNLFPEISTAPNMTRMLFGVSSNTLIAESLENGYPVEIVWSESVPLADDFDAEYVVSLPKLGDILIFVTKSCGGVKHIYMETISRIEISAKEIRERIQQSVLPQIDLPSSSTSVLLGPTGRVTSLQTKMPIVGDKSDDCGSAKPTWKIGLSLYTPSIQVNFMTAMNECSLTLILDHVCFTLSKQIEKKPLRIRHLRKHGIRMFELQIWDIQLENPQSHQDVFDFPVILTRKDQVENSIPLISHHSQLEKLPDFLRPTSCLIISCCQDIDVARQCSVIKSFIVSVQPLSMYLEDTILIKCISTMELASKSSAMFLATMENSTTRDDSVTVPGHATNPLIFEHFEVKPISVSISLHTSMKVFIALDRSPLHFSSYVRNNVHTTPYALGHSITRHFLSSALFKAGWVVGSLELIGSPTGFALTLGSGIRDFVRMPYQGILQGPWGFLTGVTHGSASLMKHVTAGTLSSIANIASSVARNLDRCSLDSEHVERVEQARRMHPHGVSQNLVQGLSNLGISLLGALSGIAHHPLNAVVHHGSEGSLPISRMLAGVGLGIVGAITKPLSGAAELVALTGQGLLQDAGWSTVPRLRQKSVRTLGEGAYSTMYYGWKFSPPLKGSVLLVMDVTTRSPSDRFEAAVLVLTTETLYLVDAESQEISNFYPIRHIHVDAPTTDSTMLLVGFEKCDNPIEVWDVSKLRVEEYVSQSRLDVRDSAIGSPQICLDHDESSSNSFGSPSLLLSPDLLTIHVNPQWREHLASLIHLGRRQAKGTGFDVL